MMKIKAKTKDTALSMWLSGWCDSLKNLDAKSPENEKDHQDFLAKEHLLSLNMLLNEEVFVKLLAKSYERLLVKVDAARAKEAVKRFLINACWICNHSQKPDTDKKRISKQYLGDLKKDWVNLSNASIKLADQIKKLSPKNGPDSYSYLDARLNAGNQVGYIFNRKNAWGRVNNPHPDRLLSELLVCFASDILEEAALLDIAIGKKRQSGGAQSELHFAMDALTSASLNLAIDAPPKPDFALVNRVILILINPAEEVDPSTVRKRYRASRQRKSQA